MLALMTFTRFTLLALMLSLAACSSFPEFPLTTPEPLTVNINVKMDVYQHQGDAPNAGDKPKPTAEATADPGEVTPELRQAAERGMRDRMEQIQTLKNNRLVGENRDGLLEVREIPPGEYGEYTQKTVADENADRDMVMRALSLEESKPLTSIKREQGLLRHQQSFKGEWVEDQEADGSWRWIQKATNPR